MNLLKFHYIVVFCVFAIVRLLFLNDKKIQFEIIFPTDVHYILTLFKALY